MGLVGRFAVSGLGLTTPATTAAAGEETGQGAATKRRTCETSRTLGFRV